MAFALDYNSLDSELKKKIKKELIVKPKKSQYNQEPIPVEVFDKEEDGTIYLPLRQYSEYLECDNDSNLCKDMFPHSPDEYDRINLEFKYKLYTKETDPSNRGRDQDILIKEAINQLDSNHTTFISAYTGYGKCLAPGTEVLMYDGSKKKVENIIVGDKIMGDDSTPRNILSVCEGNQEMFEIIPTKGESFTVNKSHILTFCPEDGPNKAIFDISVEEYLRLPTSQKNILRCYWAPVEYEYSDVPIDPYLLGVWLGSGTLTQTCVEIADIEIVEYLRDFCSKNELIFHRYFQKDNVPTYRIIGSYGFTNYLLLEMKKIKLIGNKHIPLLYKANSRETRTRVLAGLVDTIGSVKAGRYEIIQNSKKLSFDIRDLCRSLGFACFVLKINEEENYLISFYGEGTKDIPVLLEHKKLTFQEDEYPLVTEFKILSKGEGKYHGFQIDKNKRFLLGNYMVTHNTSCATYLLCHYSYKTVILCHNDTLKEQWKDEIIKFTGGKAIIQIMKGNKPYDPKADVYIIGIQKATKTLMEDVINIGMVIIDESHICTISAFTKSLLKFQPMYLIGLSATPERVDGLHTLLELYFGPCKKFIKREEVKEFTVIKYKTNYKPIISYTVVYGKATLAWTNMMSSLADIKERWVEIAEIAISEPKHKIILLCDRKEMATNIYNYLIEKGDSVELLIGSKKTWDKTKRILVAGVKKGGVGLNDPNLTMLIVAADMKNVKQCEGRIRTTNNIVYDVVDNYKTLETHWNMREKWYLKRGAEIVQGGILENTTTSSIKKSSSQSNQKSKRFLKPNSE